MCGQGHEVLCVVVAVALGVQQLGDRQREAWDTGKRVAGTGLSCTAGCFSFLLKAMGN